MICIWECPVQLPHCMDSQGPLRTNIKRYQVCTLPPLNKELQICDTSEKSIHLKCMPPKEVMSSFKQWFIKKILNRYILVSTLILRCQNGSVLRGFTNLNKHTFSVISDWEKIPFCPCICGESFQMCCLHSLALVSVESENRLSGLLELNTPLNLNLR